MSEEQAEPRRVLVAEDEGLIRLDIVETLTQAGFEVVGEAADGEEAVELALELEPDLCVMDVKMPKMDGITAAEKILQELSCAVVMLTAFSQTELVERARDAGAMAYVVKPFSPADLQARGSREGSAHEEHGDERARGLPLDSEDVDGSSPVHARGCRRGDQPGRRLSHRCANGEGHLTLPIAVHSYSVVA